MATSEEIRGFRAAMMEMIPRSRFRTLAVFAIVAATSAGCTRIDNALAMVPIFAFMRDAPSFDPYEHPLPAPPGSVPFESPNGVVLAPLEGTHAAIEAFAATPEGQNPLAADDPAALTLGQAMYDRHCMVCHGIQGRGDGPIIGAGKFPLAPSLVEGTALTRSDGYMYGIVRAGRVLMPSYGARMTHIERWAVVTYVNQLQAQAGAAAPAATQPAATAPAPATTGRQ